VRNTTRSDGSYGLAEDLDDEENSDHGQGPILLIESSG
jgi:hypothetical protein